MNRPARTPSSTNPARWVFPVLFLLACGLAIWFLHLFTVVDESPTYIVWDESVVISAEGEEEPIPTDYVTDTAEEGVYRFVGTLPEGLPAGSLLFEASGLSVTLELDSVEIWSSSAVTPSTTSSMAQADIPLPAGASGELVMTCTVIDGTNMLFPPLVRFVPQSFDDTQSYAIANTAALPAGAAALAFVLVIGLFLLSCMLKRPDWSLVALAVATASLVVFLIAQGQAALFLPHGVADALSHPSLGFVTLAALVVYLAMNRQRSFWRLLGLATAWSAAGLLVCYLASLVTGGYLAFFINSQLSSLINGGYYTGLLYWVTMWLTAVSALISAYGVARSFADQQAAQQAAVLKNEMVGEGYRALKSKMRETAGLRHELKNQLTALDALYRQGDYAGMKELLDTMRRADDEQVQTIFTENMAVNIILQDAATRARAGAIDFDARALLPAHLGIPEKDLCVLLMNMLDNALEACAQIDRASGRFVRFRIKIAQGHLAVRCENSYDGTVRATDEGHLATTKADAEGHGFGLGQMRAVAEKYGSSLEISRTEGVFTVQTALKLPHQDDEGARDADEEARG